MMKRVLLLAPCYPLNGSGCGEVDDDWLLQAKFQERSGADREHFAFFYSRGRGADGRTLACAFSAIHSRTDGRARCRAFCCLAARLGACVGVTAGGNGNHVGPDRQLGEAQVEGIWPA